ncbi:hypothetical protein QCA50_014346 [Cerrena zonata]|uniref:Uncharacterized protein n=1 Tax=Cerrena zonata TaxID=2478898 RepID=A0AAW0FYX1_9APHY
MTSSSSSNTNGLTANGVQLSESYIQDCFHSYLKSSLTQAKAERLLDTETLSSAEGDLMITGPALCLYFAALRSTTNPPSVPLPRLNKNSAPPTDLSLNNCPSTFRPFLIIWSHAVPDIQSLTPEHQHDLARIICTLPPLSQPINPRLNGIAADLRAVAIEISMRRTFQDRYATDLQAAIDAGGSNSELRVKASFVPPPSYDEPSSPPPIPTSSWRPESPPPAARRSRPSLEIPSSPSGSSSRRSPSPLPSIFAEDAPAIDFIRETLYAALLTVIERMPTLRRLMKRDAPRAYFAAVSFAILDVASSTNIKHSSDGVPVIHGVLDRTLSLSECPPDLRPFMQELCEIGHKMREMEEEDSEATVDALQHGQEAPRPRLDRVRDVIEGGVGHVYNERPRTPRVSGESRRSQESSSDRGSGRPVTPDPRRRTTSTENRAVAFANRINALALAMTKLRAFRERQDMVFQVLTGVERK